jgi:hypothetical protein
MQEAARAKRWLDNAARIDADPVGISYPERGIYLWGNLRGLEMRFFKKVPAALVLATALLHAPCNRSLAATNCGFLTIEQCRASVSGIGGFCVPNQFYNPQRSAKDTRKRQEVRAYAMPYDPYPWCAQYSEGDM